MDIYAYIIRDHRKISVLMERIATTRDVQKRQDTFIALRREFNLHADCEEQTFYRAIKEATDSRLVRHEMSQAVADHDSIRNALRHLSRLPFDSEDWISTFEVFRQDVLHHVEEEENHTFSMAQRCLSEPQTLELVRDIQALKAYMRQAVMA